MLNFLKFKGDEGDLAEFDPREPPEGISPESLAMIGALLAQDAVDEFDFVFAQLSQTKEGAFDGGSLKIKFDNSDGTGEELVADMEEYLSQFPFVEYESMLVELGNGDAYFKIGYRNLPFNDNGEEPPTDEIPQSLADMGDDLFG